MKLHFISYLFSLFLNCIFITALFFSYLASSSKLKEEIKVSLVSPSTFSVKPSYELLSEVPLSKESSLSSSKNSISSKIFPTKPHSGKSFEKKETFEKDIISEKISKLRSKKEFEELSQLTQEEMRELEGKLKGLKGKTKTGAEVSTQGIIQKGEETHSDGYLFLIKRKLQTNFEVPIYLRRKPGLRAVVSLEISSTGEILSYKFIQKSEEPLFNQAIEKCLKISQPFPVNNKVKILVEFKAEGIGKIN